MKKIVITGALGHIGSRLIRQLPSQFPQAELLLLDNLSTQRYPSLFDLPPAGRYRFVEADVLQADLEGLLKGAEALVHLAAITNAAESFSIAEQIEKVNFEGARRVARCCAKMGVAMIFLSTTSVYGVADGVVSEDDPDDNLKPQSPYAESKLKAERMLETLGRQEGLDFVTCRFGTIFGISPGMRFHTAVNKFVWQACMGLPITVWRTALRQQRPYLDLGDGVEAIGFLLRQRHFDRQIYNVVTVNATVEEVINVISAHIPDIRIEYVDTPIMNQLSYTVSGEKFRRIGFRYGGDLREAVGESIALLRAARSAE